MNNIYENYDVAVVGAGHAGCEAALACARLGLETIMFTVSLDSIAMMPCNPNIGGTSKGHLVREIDALGGEMGKNIDRTFIQSKMLNLSKGPAVHSKINGAFINPCWSSCFKTIHFNTMSNQRICQMIGGGQSVRSCICAHLSANAPGS